MSLGLGAESQAQGLQRDHKGMAGFGCLRSDELAQVANVYWGH